MIETIKDNNDFVIGYIEWEVVNKDGQFQDLGEYCYIQDLWVHKEFRGMGALNFLIGKIDRHPWMKNVKWVYWDREKFNKPAGPFPRQRLAKLGARNVE